MCQYGYNNHSYFPPTLHFHISHLGKYWYAFSWPEEVRVWHTVSYHPTSSTGVNNGCLYRLPFCCASKQMLPLRLDFFYHVSEAPATCIFMTFIDFTPVSNYNSSFQTVVTY